MSCRIFAGGAAPGWCRAWWMVVVFVSLIVPGVFADECPVNPLNSTMYQAPYASPAGLPRCSGTITRWSVCEVCQTSAAIFNLKDAYTNSYKPTSSLQPTATFVRGGTSVTVQGFVEKIVNSRAVFRTRFSPTITGAWSFTTTSSDAGLRITLPQTVSVSTSSARGFSRRDSTYTDRFVFDNGSRYFMWGQTYYNLINHARVNNTWQASVDNSRAYGLNKLRLLLYPFGPLPGFPYGDTQPFTDSNHEALDAGHWAKFDEVIGFLHGRGMIADVILFNDNARTFAVTIGSVEGKQRDQRYVRYTLARYGAFANVIWCLTNEWNLSPSPYDTDESYWDALGAILEVEDPWARNSAGQRRPLSIHPRNDHVFQFFGPTWPSYAVLQNGIRNGRHCPPSTGTVSNPHFNNGDEWGNYTICRNLGNNMPVANDEYGYIASFKEQCVTVAGVNPLGRTHHRFAIWGTAMAGGYGSAGDAAVVNGWQPILTADWRTPVPAEYSDIQSMSTFFQSNVPEWWRLRRDTSVLGVSSSCTPPASRAYALSLPGLRYVVYASQGNSVQVNLPPGTWSWRPWDPRTTNGGIWLLKVLRLVQGGSSQTITLPDGQDWVLLIEPHS